ncbi:MAG: PilZ domain-containing protein [Acidimicrobiales bacterium]|nr:PilZ domain-containing protein [Acidimicrobiales bacterium]
MRTEDGEVTVRFVGESALVESEGTQLPGRVTAETGSTLTIRCDQQLSAEPVTREVLVSVFAVDALYRICGKALMYGSEVATAPDAAVERIQRRKWPRHRMDLAVTLCPVKEGVRLEGVPGRTVDLSVGGLCAETLRPVEGEGDPVVILSLPDGTSVVSGVSTVASEDLGDGWRYRMAFLDLAAHDYTRLVELTAG